MAQYFLPVPSIWQTVMCQHWAGRAFPLGYQVLTSAISSRALPVVPFSSAPIHATAVAAAAAPHLALGCISRAPDAPSTRARMQRLLLALLLQVYARTRYTLLIRSRPIW